MKVERPLHVVILSAYMRFPNGMAATNRARLLARAMEEAGVRVRVLVLQAGERPPHVENTAVRGVYRGTPFDYTSGTTIRRKSFMARRVVAARGWIEGAFRLLQLRRRGELDVVYAWHMGWPRDLIFASLRALGVPVVTEVNERPWSLRERQSLAQRARSPLAGVSGVVVISRFLEDWVRAEARRLGKTVEIMPVPIIVDMDEHAPEPYPSGEPLFVFAGAPQYDATIRFIFNAMRSVWQEFPDCRLVVTGANPADPAARWLLDEASRLFAEPRLEIAGYLSRDELLRLYGKARALLVPLFDDVGSRARFPTKIGEYLAAARPIVTSAVGEIPRYFEDGVDAVVCPPGDELAYGERLVGLLRDPEAAAAIGVAGRELAAQRFDYSLYGGVLRRGFLVAARRRDG